MTYSCRKCQKIFADDGLPPKISFREECSGCGQDLHSCWQCQFYDPSAYNECRENQAERVLDKDRANRCEFFVAASLSGQTKSTDKPVAENSARKALEDLFK